MSAKQNPKQPINYQAFTAMGVVFLGVGIAQTVPEVTRAAGIPLLAMGIIFLAIGLSKQSRKSLH